MSDILKTIFEPVSDKLQKVDQKIKSYLETGVPVIDDSSMHLFSKSGKKVRAALAILTSGLSSSYNESVIDLAAAMEIIHAASLVHDDIIDKSFMRRGLVSVPSRFGDKIAVLAGDYMYAVAVNIAVNSGNDRILKSISNATKEMVKGELFQIEYSNLEKISEERYYQIIERKTGCLMATSAEIGAIVSGMEKEKSDSLYRMGLELGFAFQIVDDTFDFSDSSSITGKDVGNDFRDGKITIPLIYIMKNGTDSEKSSLLGFAADTENADWEALRGLVHTSGAYEYSIGKASEFAESAKKRLEKFPDSDYKDVIEKLINFIVERNY